MLFLFAVVLLGYQRNGPSLHVPPASCGFVHLPSPARIEPCIRPALHLHPPTLQHTKNPSTEGQHASQNTYAGRSRKRKSCAQMPPPPRKKRHGGGCSSSEENPIKRATSAALHTTTEADRPHLAFPTRRIPNPHPYWRRGQGSCITSSGRPSSAERRHWRLQPAALQSIQKGYLWLAHIQPFYFILRCWFSVVPAQSRPL